jgi:hypothetical protein
VGPDQRLYVSGAGIGVRLREHDEWCAGRTNDCRTHERHLGDVVDTDDLDVAEPHEFGGLLGDGVVRRGDDDLEALAPVLGTEVGKRLANGREPVGHEDHGQLG